MGVVAEHLLQILTFLVPHLQLQLVIYAVTAISR